MQNSYQYLISLFQARPCTCRMGHALTCSSHVHKSVWRKCWQWEDSKCNGLRVYKENEEFGASFRDKFPHKGREEIERNPSQTDAVYGNVSTSYYQVKFDPGNLSGVGNMKTIHIQVGNWKPIQRKWAKKLRTWFCKIVALRSVLMMSLVSSRWVPRMLTPEQKTCRQQFSEENLDTEKEFAWRITDVIIIPATGERSGTRNHVLLHWTLMLRNIV